MCLKENNMNIWRMKWGNQLRLLGAGQEHRNTVGVEKIKGDGDR